MEKKIIKLLHEILEYNTIQSDDIPNIELYMDQLTTFMETHLEEHKRYADDKIMTKTMVNNYTKNHLLPASNKKKYSKEHIFLLIMIYFYKNVLSISDIQNLLSPLSNKYFPENPQNGITLESIYTDFMEMISDNKPDGEEQILNLMRKSFSLYDHEDFDQKEKDELSLIAFISQLCVDIYVRKQLVERLIDKVYPPESKDKKNKTQNKKQK